MKPKEKFLPKGTTQEQWDRYELDMKAHEDFCAREKPTDPEKLGAWEMMRFCDAPNKPGYYRANND